MPDFSRQFREAMFAAGLVPPETIEADGKLHRFASNGKRGDDAGWYVLFLDGIPAGSFGDWRTGLVQTWRAEIGRTLTTAEQAAHRERMEAMRRNREAEQERMRGEAASKAAAIWAKAAPCTGHPYLTRKGVQAHGARIHKGLLVIPLRAEGALHSLQFINDDGKSKPFLTGGRVAGCYYSIGNTKGAEALCIAEGFATGATIHESTGHPVAVAFNAGNLEAVALAMRAKFPDFPIIVCADDDWRREGNIGKTKATAAALAVGAKLAMPQFGEDRPESAKDFNDMAAICGAEAVKQAIERAEVPAIPTRQPGGETALASDLAPRVELLRASDITPKPITWLWCGWLAAGKMHILGGAPGTGKTTIAMKLAATVTTGGSWPDGSRCGSGNVVIWSGEDDPEDTLVPRLSASGADHSRVYFVSAVKAAGERRAFDPARDIEILRHKLMEVGNVRLLIVDPIVSAIMGDSHKNAEVRRALQPLADIAATMKCALLGITHFSKGTSNREPVERITGSLAFGALARVVLVAAKQQAEGENGRTIRLFLRAKSNIGPDDGGFEYDLQKGVLADYADVEASWVEWGNAVAGAARELLATADATDDDGEGGTLAEAKHFLSETLAHGPVAANDIKRDANGAGFSPATIRRAKKALNIEARKPGMRAGWAWVLPRRCSTNPEDAQQNSVSTFGNLEHLRASGGSDADDGEVF